jgi:phosphoserine phosphatase
MKLLVCDVEGTIFKVKQQIEGVKYASTMWQPIALALGEEAINEERETHKKHENGEYKNYIEWMQDTIKIHIKYGLKRDVFENIANSSEYNLGVV